MTTTPPPQECILPTRLVKTVVAVSLSVLTITALTGILSNVMSAETITLLFVLCLMSSVIIFKNISILRCPSKVLLSGLGFVALTAFLDSTVF